MCITLLDLEGHWNELRLASCANLRSLLFSLDTTDFAPDQIPDAVRRAYEGILEVLMDPALPAALERVTFHLTLPAESHPSLAAFNWEFVDEVLVRVHRLRSVVIDLAAGSVAPTEKISRRLARTAARGLLEFRIGEVGAAYLCIYARVSANPLIISRRPCRGGKSQYNLRGEPCLQLIDAYIDLS